MMLAVKLTVLASADISFEQNRSTHKIPIHAATCSCCPSRFTSFCSDPKRSGNQYSHVTRVESRDQRRWQFYAASSCCMSYNQSIARKAPKQHSCAAAYSTRILPSEAPIRSRFNKLPFARVSRRLTTSVTMFRQLE
jgi:hypothetical protein